jgi:hypothetical protein
LQAIASPSITRDRAGNAAIAAAASGKRQAAGRVEAFAGQEPHPARAAVRHNAESIALSREPSPNPLAVP